MSKILHGFKHTEVGVIPNDWEVKPLGSLFEISAGGDFKKQGSSTLALQRLILGYRNAVNIRNRTFAKFRKPYASV